MLFLSSQKQHRQTRGKPPTQTEKGGQFENSSSQLTSAWNSGVLSSKSQETRALPRKANKRGNQWLIISPEKKAVFPRGVRWGGWLLGHRSPSFYMRLPASKKTVSSKLLVAKTWLKFLSYGTPRNLHFKMLVSMDDSKSLP